MHTKQPLWRYGVLLSCLWLTACENTRAPAPVVNRWGHVNSTQHSYVVQAGDTIYSIAWRFGTDYKSLAAKNHLQAPYIVYPGQRLRVSGKSVRVSLAKAPVVNKVVPKASAVAVTAAPSVASVPGGGKGHLPWPLTGKLLAAFGEQGNKGIDIAVPIGTPVQAVDAGSVVYAGDNLHGYGQLLIIKHGNDLMTAYAHNSKLLVKEGEKVTAGQHIALSGDSDAACPMLHFEVRQGGRPQNPLNFLVAP